MRLRLCFVASLLAVAGCHVAPKYSKPPVPQTPGAFKEFVETSEWKHANPSDGVLKGKWWQMFEDPQLNELMEEISVSNQNVKAAESRFRAARAIVRSSRAQYFPIIGVSPSIGVTGRGGASTSTTTSSTGNTTGTGTTGTGTGSTGTTSGGSRITQAYSLPFAFSWEPDLFGRISLGVDLASAQAQLSAADLENIRLSLQAELATDYFIIRGIDMEMGILGTNIESFERALQLTTNRYNGGIASRADVEQARTQLEQTRAQLTDLRVTRAVNEHAIAMLAGRAPANLTIGDGALKTEPPAIPVAVPSQLLERRPDIAANERAVAAANANIGLARVAYFPNLTLNGGAGLTATSITNWFTWPARFWSVGPGLSQTLFDFGRRRAELEFTEANYDVAVANYRQTALTAFQEVEDALSTLRYLAQEAREQSAAARAAQASLNLELDRYKGGVASFLDVIQTQAIALNAQRATVTILQRRMIASVDLIRALGGGWDVSQLPTSADVRAKDAGMTGRTP